MNDSLNDTDLELLIEAIEEYALSVESWTHPSEKLRELDKLLSKLRNLSQDPQGEDMPSVLQGS